MLLLFSPHRKVATNALDRSATNLGGVDELHAVFAEAEKMVKSILKPSPLQPTPKTPTKVAAQPVTTTNANRSESGGRFNNYKTVLCNNYARDKKCPIGDRCNFAHGKGDLRTPVCDRTVIEY